MGEVIPVLFGKEHDPEGIITCACGEVFSGADFQERWAQYLLHITTCHA